MDVKQILASRYALQPRSAPNRLSSKSPRSGCLLRVFFHGLARPGHADLFPWPELGDEPLEEQLQSLREAPRKLGRAALAWAHYEAQGKAISREGRVINHFTLSEPGDIPAHFTHAKLKITPALISSWSETEAYCRRYPHILWRFDFNSLFSDLTSASSFWAQVTPQLKAQIDFIEDPVIVPLMKEADTYRIFSGTNLAVDRDPSDEALALAQVWVIKPVTQTPEALRALLLRATNKRVVFTSNMDHPMGQLIALHAARNFLTTEEPCGLLTHELYATHQASPWIATKEKLLVSSHSGSGWVSFDELNRLSWEPL